MTPGGSLCAFAYSPSMTDWKVGPTPNIDYPLLARTEAGQDETAVQRLSAQRATWNSMTYFSRLSSESHPIHPVRSRRAGTTTKQRPASIHLELVGADIDLLRAVAVAVDDAGVVVDVEAGQ